MNWPKRKDIERFYGPKGENQTGIRLPYPMVLDWEPKAVIYKLTCHEKIAEPLTRIFQNILDEYGMTKIRNLGIDQFGGCLNVRLMRGSKKTWSMHSWGIAVDLDPDRNTLRETKRTARFARPEYLPMWRIIEAEGAYSLGRREDRDWMHFEFTSGA